LKCSGNQLPGIVVFGMGKNFIRVPGFYPNRRMVIPFLGTGTNLPEGAGGIIDKLLEEFEA